MSASVTNDDPISQSVNPQDLDKLDQRLQSKAIELSMTQKHKSQKSERVLLNAKTNERQNSDIFTDHTVIDQVNLLDESGNLMPPMSTVRGVEISNNDFAIKEEKDEGDIDDKKDK